MLIEEKIFSLIDQSNHILMISHRRPDGDTLGSSGVFLSYLQEKGKDAALFCVDQIPGNLQFLIPNKTKILHDSTSLDLNNYDLVIAMDCGELKQTSIPDLLKQRGPNTFLINIDHHYTNDSYGDLNLVNSVASSTCEVVYHIFKSQKVPVDRHMTNALLTGILSDTTYFSNGATTIEAIRAASDLLGSGAKIKDITQSIWKNKDIETLQLWGKIFDRLQYNEEKKIAIAIIYHADLQEISVPENALEGIANFLTTLYEAKVILVLSQLENNIIKGSLRTTHADVDVSAIAKRHGGGGHKKAAGFTINGTINDTFDIWSLV
jgi:phosphoesterase RecJ-like protein